MKLLFAMVASSPALTGQGVSCLICAEVATAASTGERPWRSSPIAHGGAVPLVPVGPGTPVCRGRSVLLLPAFAVAVLAS